MVARGFDDAGRDDGSVAGDGHGGGCGRVVVVYAIRYHPGARIDALDCLKEIRIWDATAARPIKCDGRSPRHFAADVRGSVVNLSGKLSPDSGSFLCLVLSLCFS